MKPVRLLSDLRDCRLLGVASLMMLSAALCSLPALAGPVHAGGTVQRDGGAGDPSYGPGSIEIGTFARTVGEVTEFESLAGRHVRSVLWYQGWDASSQPSFPAAELNSVVLYHDGYNTHTIVHLTWEPWVSLGDIAAGVYDAYLTGYAAQAQDWGEPLRLRFAHEMIQDGVFNDCYGQSGCPEWYPWQDQPGAYVAAYRHVRDVFRSVGASNVQFVWCPNNWPFDLSLVQQYYPGQEYVDWLCTDGYNWTNRDGQPGWPDWQWFDDIYYPIYHTFVDHPEIFGQAPIMIGEFAACEAGPYELPGQTKCAWITNAFERLGSADYARIKAFYWFNINKECDWRISSSDASLAAFRAAISSSSFVSHAREAVYVPLVLCGKRSLSCQGARP
jgi:hypothetical protein